MLKEGWSFLSVGLDVQSAMLDMLVFSLLLYSLSLSKKKILIMTPQKQNREKRQNKGEIDEEEMKKLEQDLSGKVRSKTFPLSSSLSFANDWFLVIISSMERK